ncbi:MAG: hypothetical protein BGO12_16195 [Verrucomicrobia bacterium 61-8]|nr:MAG: hypothetical protein BGO12_16195 [Verrucomicrobia bacterium 61-8]
MHVDCDQPGIPRDMIMGADAALPDCVCIAQLEILDSLLKICDKREFSLPRQKTSGMPIRCGSGNNGHPPHVLNAANHLCISCPD